MKIWVLCHLCLFVRNVKVDFLLFLHLFLCKLYSALVLNEILKDVCFGASSFEK